MIRISLSILYKKFNQTCKKRHMPNCRVRNRLNVLHKGGHFIEKTVKIEKISIVTCFMFMPDLMPFVNCHQNFTFAFKAPLIGQFFIFWTISQLQAVIDRYTSKPERCFLFYNHLINFLHM